MKTRVELDLLLQCSTWGGGTDFWRLCKIMPRKQGVEKRGINNIAASPRSAEKPRKDSTS